MISLFIFAVCLAASIVGGICGIGGGVVIKPVLDLTGVMSVSAVSFLSGLTVLSMSVISVLRNRGSNELEPQRSVPLGLGAAVGGVIGKLLFESIKQSAQNDRVVGLVQAVLLGVMVLGTLGYVCVKARIASKQVRNPAASSTIGLALGVCSSFLGIGGGPMNLAVMHYCFSMGTKQAAANSLLVILLSQVANLIFSLVRGAVPSFELLTLILMVAAGVSGGLVASRLHKKLSVQTTDRLFKGLLVVIFLICVYNALRAL
ncbi:MAG: sulfite exporter TauE/SafE family protein [Clostridia bacterium]|nr:sulfite exporter TauE/SafE family protein [Clostridia bacterium]